MLGDMISVQGAVDTHIHSHPCLFPRLTDDRGVVEAATNAGMAGVMLKYHFESTASRAHQLAARGKEGEEELHQVEEEIDRLVAQLWGLTEEELEEIKRALAELGA